MTANSLLLWMSARQEGTWPQFRAAVQRLHAPEEQSLEAAEENGDGEAGYGLRFHQVLWLNLQSLGHAEFFSGAGESDWRVTPPCLAATPRPAGWLGVLAGARSPKLLARLSGAAGPSLHTVGSDQCPDVVLVNGSSLDALKSLAHTARISIQPNAPATILMNLPAIDDPAVRRTCELPMGRDWKVEQFSAAELRWLPAARRDAERATCGLFRFSLPYRREVVFCSKGTFSRIPARVGIYLMLRRARRKLLQYNRADTRLSVPATCRPPFLIERALVLCSGLPPSPEAGAKGRIMLHYRDIPTEIAGLASALLRQG